MTDKTPWCCAGYVSECPLCPEYGTRMIDPCPGHPAEDANQQVVDTARLHAERRHPGFEYATTRGQRKQWDDADRPPAGENCDPDHTWQPNLDAGRPGMGWDRFEYHEEAYWRRPKSTGGPRETSGGPRSASEPPDGELSGRNGDRSVETASGGSDELTAEEARDLVDELGLQLYRAQDALAFVEECCVIADREQKPITTADVREWLKGARCGRQLAADAQTATQATEARAAADRVRKAAQQWRLAAHEGDLSVDWDEAAVAALALLDNPNVTYADLGFDCPAITGHATMNPPAAKEQP
ncbi:hypothetical protein [Streptomyces sp. NBC_01373]|uniref:hypothetical protein n=1 Tax=Streptomyces sp. NBC_01373 TaxID=2903843 RepID=UPI002256832C|nr:hypothetical protein [Streptomyces sp. NBC_01373]MCX4697026.1 hypothetical protein [Streptomyces sp. NBC_01373]MCX4707049.1 hypothetical protein [Streptomyces sp. NBC_01373]